LIATAVLKNQIDAALRVNCHLEYLLERIMTNHPAFLYTIVISAGALLQACSTDVIDSTPKPAPNIEASQTQAGNDEVMTKGRWPPAEACDFLSRIPGLQTRGYKDLVGDGEYSCSSTYKELGGDSIMSNDIAYYAYGSSGQVRKLEIVLNVKSRNQSVQAHKELKDISSELTQKAIGNSLPDAAAISITQGKPGRWMVGGYLVEVIREEWPTGKGYEIHFIIPPPRQ
jgi:hypothetical protein